MFGKGERVQTTGTGGFSAIRAGYKGTILKVENTMAGPRAVAYVKMDKINFPSYYVFFFHELVRETPKKPPVRYVYYNAKRDAFIIYRKDKSGQSLGTHYKKPVSAKRLKKEGPEAMGFVKIGRE